MSNELVTALRATLSFEKNSLANLRLVLTALLEQGNEDFVVREFLTYCPEATAIECAVELSRATGAARLGQILSTIWDQMNESQRLRAASLAGVVDVLGDDIWLSVFECGSNSVHVRHRIAAGLTKSQCAETREHIPSLLSRIGTYDDPQRQMVLDRFVESFSRPKLDTRPS